MKKFQILFTRTIKEKYGAFSKARNDVSRVLSNCGYRKVVISSFQNYPYLIRHFVGSLHALLKFLRMPKGSLCYLQYPFDMYYSFLVFPLVKKRIHFVVIIHDLFSCRTLNGDVNRELCFLSKFDCIVAHTDSMKDLLVKHGIDATKIKVLWLFDYLVNKEPDDNLNNDNSICFAGSLKKSRFLLDQTFLSISTNQIFLYGQMDKEINSKNITYLGKFEPDDISDIKGEWGLVWDGDSAETCAGPMGEYLRINSSHKLSLYLAAHKPVIVWKESALANYVVENHLGIAIDSLLHISDSIKSLSSEETRLMKQSVIDFSKKLTNGEMLSSVCRQIEESNISE